MMMAPVGVRGTAAVAEPAAMVVPAVGYAVVDMEAGHGTAFHGAQRKTISLAIPALVVVPAVNHAVMRMAASKGTILNRTNGYHGLPRPSAPPVTAAFCVPAVGERGHSQQVNGHDARQAGNKGSFDSHSGQSPFKSGGMTAKSFNHKTIRRFCNFEYSRVFRRCQYARAGAEQRFTAATAPCPRASPPGPSPLPGPPTPPCPSRARPRGPRPPRSPG